MTVAVEINAVGSRMGKHAVEYYPDAKRGGVRRKALKVRLRPEYRIGAHIVGGVIAVV